MDAREVPSLARTLMNEHGLGHWTLQWDRAVRRMGACHYRRRQITLSRPLVERAPVEVVTNTILHEIAHALAGPGVGHGPTWKRIARSIGCTGERCYNAAAVEPIAGKWQAQCPSCGKTYHRHRLSRGTYSCGRCGPARGQLNFARAS